MSYPLLNGKFILVTDPSNTGIVTILSQIDERNYCVIQRLLLSIMKNICTSNCAIEGSTWEQTMIHLSWFLQIRNPERLQGFDFEIGHHAERIQLNIDALSRRPSSASFKYYLRIKKKDIWVSWTTDVDTRWSFDVLVIVARYSPQLRGFLRGNRSFSNMAWHRRSWGIVERKQMINLQKRISKVLEEVQDGLSG